MSNPYPRATPSGPTGGYPVQSSQLSGGVPPEIPAAEMQTAGAADDRQIARRVVLLSIVGCGLLQLMSIGIETLIIFAVIGLMAWFLLLQHLFPLLLFFTGNLLLRLVMSSNRNMSYFRDQSLFDFIGHLMDSVSFVAMVGLAFVYFEMDAKRLHPQGKFFVENRRMWHVFRPFGSLAILLPMGTVLAVVAYFFSQQIYSPFSRGILYPEFAQAYLFVMAIFLLFLMARTLLDIRDWRGLSIDESHFYLQQQVGVQAGEELDEQGRGGWAEHDHASAASLMFFVQCMASALLAIVMVSLSRSRRFGGGEYMWPAVAGVFVFLTAAYNARRTSKADVISENHIITFVGFIVVCIVGTFSLQFPPWPWGVVYLGWTALNAMVIIRLSYLWMQDESQARINHWDRAMPFSWLRVVILIIEGLCGATVLLVVLRGLWNFFV